MSNKKPLTEAQRASQRRYDKEHRTRVSVLLVNTTDADIIEFLKGKNKQVLIKQLIRRYMDEQGMGPHVFHEK